MADEKPTLHIDTDWKRQAQEEKRRLAEQEKQRAASASPPPTGVPPGAPAGAVPGGLGAPGATAGEDEAMGMPRAGTRGGAGARGERGERGEMPPASLAGLTSQLMTQTLFYLGELAQRGGEPVVNLDMAKHNIDLLGVLDEKTKGNLTPEEKKLLDSVLYELRMRYVSTASQYIT